MTAPVLTILRGTLASSRTSNHVADAGFETHLGGVALEHLTSVQISEVDVSARNTGYMHIFATRLLLDRSTMLERPSRTEHLYSQFRGSKKAVG